MTTGMSWPCLLPSGMWWSRSFTGPHLVMEPGLAAFAHMVKSTWPRTKPGLPPQGEGNHLGPGTGLSCQSDPGQL